MTKETKDQFAILYVQEALMHPICSKLQWPDSLSKIYKEHQAKIYAFAKEHLPKRTSIRGCISDDDYDTSHYDIDKALRKNYSHVKEEVRPDSESGGFYCYITSEHLEDVKKFLDVNFPTLEYNVDDDEDGDIYDYMLPFGNWTYAEEYIKENNIEVPPIFDGTDILARLNDFDERIKALEKGREEFLNSLN